MLQPIEATDPNSEPGPTRNDLRWSPILALVVVVALLVIAVFVFTNDEVSQPPNHPQPTEAPDDPGA